MRIEVDQFASDGSAQPKYGWAVYLDEKYCHYVQMADNVEGIVEAPLIDDEGTPLFDLYDDNYSIVQRKGTVRIERRDDSLLQFTPEEQKKSITESPFYYLTQPRGFV